MSDPSFIQVSSAERFTIDNSDAEGFDRCFSGWGVPSRYLESISNSLLKTLEQLGIDPSNVLFSGYSTSDSDSHDSTLDDQKVFEYVDKPLAERIENIAIEMVELDELGELTDELRSQFLAQISYLKAAKKVPQKYPEYYFADYGEFSGDDSNPILYAGSFDNSVIGVFDKAKLEAINHPIDDGIEDKSSSLYGAGGEFIVRATLPEIAEAKILEYHPRYVDVRDKK